MLVGTITTLVYFHFGAKATAGGPQRSKLVIWLGWIGQVFIAITLGVLFAGVFCRCPDCADRAREFHLELSDFRHVYLWLDPWLILIPSWR